MKKYLIPKTGKWYKANLHCHSTVSDGRYTPEQIKEAYLEQGYSVVAYTDHDVLISHSDLTDENFLALNGYEMEITEEGDKPWDERKTCHMCLIALKRDNLKQVCYHRTKYLFGHATEHRDEVKFDESLPDYERRYTPECINDMVRIGRENGFFVTYNHPVWSLESYPEYSQYKGFNAMEICNFGCYVMGYPDYNPQVYDDMLRLNNRLYCTATDDNHDAYPPEHGNHDSFGGYTVIKAKNLDYEAITSALEKGNFYASTGAVIKEMYLDGDQLHVKTGPAKSIAYFTGIRRAGKVASQKGTVSEAVFTVKPTDRYFRITVTDKKGGKAESRAYFTDEVLK